MKILKALRCIVFMVFIVILSFLTGMLGDKTQQIEINTGKKGGYDCVIGIIFYGYPDLNEIMSKSVFNYAEYIEENFNVKFEFASTLQMSQVDAVEKLCGLGVDVIFNASTQSIPDCIAICEEKQVYWLQIFDMPMDTDIVDKFIGSKYYLGCIINDEERASEIMATTMLNMGMNQIGIVTYPESLSTSNIHTVRGNAIQRIINEKDPNSVNFVLKISSVKSGIESVAAQNYHPDSLIFTTKTSSFSVDELKEQFNNPQLKIAYFDLNSTTRQELLQGDCLTVSCGQHNIIGLAFAYAYNHITSEHPPESKLELTSDYIILTSVEQYDQYIQYFVDSMPYSAEELSRIISSLDTTVELMTEYSNSYSLLEVIEKN